MSECSNCDVLRSQKRELNIEIGRLSAENVILNGCANEGNKFCAGYKRIVSDTTPDMAGVTGWIIIEDNDGLLIENQKTGERRHIWYGGLAEHITKIERLTKKLVESEQLYDELLQENQSLLQQAAEQEK